MQATMATNRGISRLNKDHFYTRSERLVLDHFLKLAKPPIVDTFDLASISNSCEVFKDDSLITCFGISHDLLTNAMIGVGHESSFSTRETYERTFRAFTPVGLKTGLRSFDTSFLMANLIRAVKLVLGSDGNAFDSQINSHTSRWLLGLSLRKRNGNVRVKLALPVDQFSRAGFALLELSSHLGRHLQLSGHSTFGTDRQKSCKAILAKRHRAGIIPDRRMRLKLVKLIRLASVDLANLCNCINHVLSGKNSPASNQMITRVMDVVFSVQVLLKGKLRKSIASTVEFFHRGLQFLGRFCGYDQFGFYREGDRHFGLSIAEMFSIARVFTAPEVARSGNSSPSKLAKMLALDGVSFERRR